MSRSYSIRIPVEVLIPKGSGLGEGSFSMVFTMLEILAADRMRELLKQELADKGFVETPEGMAMPVEGAKKAVLDLETMVMKLTVPLPDSCTIQVEEEYLKQFQEKLQKSVENGSIMNDWNVSNKVERLKDNAVQQLKNIAVEARKEVNSALKEVYREAIREKAASLGNVETISETKEGHTYRIRIEIST